MTTFTLDSKAARSFAARVVEDAVITDEDFELAKAGESTLQDLLDEARATPGVINGPDSEGMPVFVDWDESETDIYLGFNINVVFFVDGSQHRLVITSTAEEPRKIGDRKHRGAKAIFDFLEFAIPEINSALADLSAYAGSH